MHCDPSTVGDLWPSLTHCKRQSDKAITPCHGAWKTGTEWVFFVDTPCHLPLDWDDDFSVAVVQTQKVKKEMEVTCSHFVVQFLGEVTWGCQSHSTVWLQAQYWDTLICILYPTKPPIRSICFVRSKYQNLGMKVGHTLSHWFRPSNPFTRMTGHYGIHDKFQE